MSHILEIMLLVSATNLGDVSNAKRTVAALEAIANDTKNANQTINIQTRTMYVGQEKEFIIKCFSEASAGIAADRPRMLLAVGEHGGKALSTLSSAKLIRKQDYVYLSNHQLFDFVKTPEARDIDHLMIPDPALSNVQKEELLKQFKHLSTPMGVPAEMPNKAYLKGLYEGWSTVHEELSNKKIIIVTLPGDAPDLNHKIKCFSRDSAKDLFNKLQGLWVASGKSATFLIQNSHRTGLHDPKTGKMVNDHKYLKGQPKPPLDLLSRSFIEWMDQSGMPYQFFNLTIEEDPTNGSRKYNSVYNQLLSIAAAETTFEKQALYVLPGESMSGLGKDACYIKPQNIIVFEPDSMNETHKRVVEHSFKLGYVSKFEPKGKGAILYPEHLTQKTKDDALQVASEIWEGLGEKFGFKFKMNKSYSNSHSKSEILFWQRTVDQQSRQLSLKITHSDNDSDRAGNVGDDFKDAAMPLIPTSPIMTTVYSDSDRAGNAAHMVQEPTSPNIITVSSNSDRAGNVGDDFLTKSRNLKL